MNKPEDRIVGTGYGFTILVLCMILGLVLMLGFMHDMKQVDTKQTIQEYVAGMQKHGYTCYLEGENWDEVFYERPYSTPKDR